MCSFANTRPGALVNTSLRYACWFRKSDEPCLHACRFMKLRLDRVMKLELGQMTPEQALAAGADYPEFPPLDRAKWTAPYSPYKPGWWKAFDPSVFFAGNSSGTNANGASH